MCTVFWGFIKKSWPVNTSIVAMMSFGLIMIAIDVLLSQDTLPSPLPIASLSKCYYSYCTTSDVYYTS